MLDPYVADISSRFRLYFTYMRLWLIGLSTKSPCPPLYFVSLIMYPSSRAPHPVSLIPYPVCPVPYPFSPIPYLFTRP